MGRVGSSTNLIDQRVELVQDMNKKSRLMNIPKDRRINGMADKVLINRIFVDKTHALD